MNLHLYPDGQQQQSSKAQRYTKYLDLDIQHLLVYAQFIVGFDLFMEFADDKKSIKNHYQSFLSYVWPKKQPPSENVPLEAVPLVASGRYIQKYI